MANLLAYTFLYGDYRLVSACNSLGCRHGNLSQYLSQAAFFFGYQDPLKSHTSATQMLFKECPWHVSFNQIDQKLNFLVNDRI